MAFNSVLSTLPPVVYFCFIDLPHEESGRLKQEADRGNREKRFVAECSVFGREIEPRIDAKYGNS